MTPAEFYRKLHTGNSGDVEFYERVCRDQQNILELGCGWGRISLPLARKGHQILGLDNDADFIAWARAEAPSNARFENADITALDPDLLASMAGHFDRILVPYNTAYAVGGARALVQMFRAARHCLKDDGELWLDAYEIDEMHAALLAGEEIPDDDGEPIVTWPDVAGPIRVFETTELRVQRQRLVVDYVAEQAGRALAQLRIVHDYVTQEQLFSALGTAGLTPTICFSGFPGPETLDSSDHGKPWVIAAAKA